jgi:hypothetical protein
MRQDQARMSESHTVEAPMNIWEFSEVLAQRLVTWSAISMTLGGVMSSSKSRYLRGVGSQFIGWAIINVAIAYFGSKTTKQRRETLRDADTPERHIQEAGNLRTLLWVNALLDVLYIVAGRNLASRRKSGAWLRGVGMGIMLQGAFLFVFDLLHAHDVDDVEN